MATVNKRARNVQAVVVNGVDSGGAMSAVITAGYDRVVKSQADGLSFPIQERECQFVRGTVRTQDWTTAISLLTGTLGTYVCYERKSGAAAATGYIKHTITNPVIHRMRFEMRQGEFASVTFDFEVRFSSEAATIATMWAMTDSQAAPTYLDAARGGWRIVSATHGDTPVNIYHVSAFSFSIAMQLAMACNDSDLGYTAVDAEAEGMMDAAGSLDFEDKEITSSKLKMVDLLLAAAGPLVLTVAQAEGAANKVITVANVIFTGGPDSMSNNTGGFASESLAFTVSNSTTTPLTLAGDDKIITIADET